MRAHDRNHAHHHPLNYWKKRAEDSADVFVVIFAVALGLVMLVGLITANGHVTWQ